MKKYLSRKICGLFLCAALSLGIVFAHPVSANAAGLGVVAVNSALIAGSNVVVNVSCSDFPASDDNIFYLFAEKVYQNSPSGAPVGSAPMAASVNLTAPLEFGTPNNHLYDKFQVAVKAGGAYIGVSNARYISNPEVLAGGSAPRKNGGKKGLIVNGMKIASGENQQLGIQQACYNILLTDVIGGNNAVPYTYNGQVYTFDSGQVLQYDHFVNTVSSQGIGITMVILNPKRAGREYMISPYSRGGACPYYMMNTSEEKGLQSLEAAMSFLAERYNGRNGHGQIDNWIIGNEVNVPGMWNYTKHMDVNSYAQLYADELRVCYTAIRSHHPTAYVCTSIDQQWNVITNGSMYTGRSFLDAMNNCILAQGNFDWGLAQHPYNHPLTWTPFWTPMNARTAGAAQHSIDTRYITIENIEQLTDYMCLPNMRNTQGGVRPILLSEIGYTDSQGAEKQAAAVVFAYQRCMTNKYITLMAYNCQTDLAAEIAQGLAEGLENPAGVKKQAWYWYQNPGAHIGEAAAVMGIGDWNARMYPR
ncbi:MAG: hypothetical protein K6F53_10725 [Lachnospiraceae bacterium]|nr:hypothetical protein [Lachnospiraceae bacterium]